MGPCGKSLTGRGEGFVHVPCAWQLWQISMVVSGKDLETSSWKDWCHTKTCLVDERVSSTPAASSMSTERQRIPILLGIRAQLTKPQAAGSHASNNLTALIKSFKN